MPVVTIVFGAPDSMRSGEDDVGIRRIKGDETHPYRGLFGCGGRRRNIVMNLPMETANVEIVYGAVDMVDVARIEDNPAAVAFIDLEEASAGARPCNHGAVVLRSATEHQPVGLRHVEVIKHRN